MDYVGDIAGRLGMRPGHSVLEIGCGSGAFLLPLREAGLRVGGIDYSPALLARALAAMPEGDFREGDAADLALPPRSYDFVVANSVFQYFADARSADQVLHSMLEAAVRAAAVLEVPDAACRLDSEAARRRLLGDEEYQKKYAGLPHQYYRREAFSESAARQGFAVEILDQAIAGYAQNAFRFNCLFRRDHRP